MKKTAALLLLVFYTATTFGVTLNFHYCGDKLDHVSVSNFINKHTCSCAPGTMPKGCCKDKKVFNKTDKHKKFIESFSFNEIASNCYLPVITDHTNYNLWPVKRSDNYFAYQVGRASLFPIYLSVRSLRI
ncbi:hypothetical protein ACVWYG_001312 [Pedobacter sp. UYEF25]